MRVWKEDTVINQNKVRLIFVKVYDHLSRRLVQRCIILVKVVQKVFLRMHKGEEVSDQKVYLNNGLVIRENEGFIIDCEEKRA